MQELEKILEKMGFLIKFYPGGDAPIGLKGMYAGMIQAYEIIKKHMNDGWIPVEEPPKKDYTAVFAVDKHDYYFVAVYDKEHGYRTNDVGADVDNIVAYRLFNPYRPERSDNYDGE